MGILDAIMKTFGHRRKPTEEPTGAGRRGFLRPLDIGKVEFAADRGDLSPAADFCYDLLGDGRVQSALTQRINGLLSYRITWEPGEKESAEALAAIDDDFYGITESGLRELYAMGHLLGVSVGELVWKRNPLSGRLVPSMNVWNPRWLGYDLERRTWTLQIDDEGKRIDITPGDGHWCLYIPSEAKRPWRSGAWRALAWPYFARKAAALDWCRYNEVFGAPIRAVTAQAGASRKTIDNLVDNLDSSKGFTSVAMPYGSKLELVAPSGDGSGTFRSILEWASDEISIALLGQNLTTSVNGGSYAAASVHAEVEASVIASDAQVEATFLHDQVVRWWAAYNFGSSDVAPWPHRVAESHKDALSAAQTLQLFGVAVQALADAGVEMDVDAFAVEYGLPIRSKGTKVEARQAGGVSDPDPAPSAEMKARGPDREALAVAAVDGADDLGDAIHRDHVGHFLEQGRMVREAVAAAESPEDLQSRLLDVFPRMESGAFGADLARALLMSDFGGRMAVSGKEAPDDVA